MLFSDLASILQIRPSRHRFGHHAIDLACVPQIWLPCNRFGCCATNMALCHRFGCCAIDLVPVPHIWLPCHRFGCCATDLAAMPQIWPPYHRFGHHATDLAQYWMHAKNLAGASDLSGLQQNKEIRKIWLLCQHFISVLQVIKMFQDKGINHASRVLRQAVKFFSKRIFFLTFFQIPNNQKAKEIFGKYELCVF